MSTTSRGTLSSSAFVGEKTILPCHRLSRIAVLILPHSSYFCEVRVMFHVGCSPMPNQHCQYFASQKRVNIFYFLKKNIFKITRFNFFSRGSALLMSAGVPPLESRTLGPCQFFYVFRATVTSHTRILKFSACLSVLTLHTSCFSRDILHY